MDDHKSREPSQSRVPKERPVTRGKEPSKFNYIAWERPKRTESTRSESNKQRAPGWVRAKSTEKPKREKPKNESNKQRATGWVRAKPTEKSKREKPKKESGGAFTRKRTTLELGPKSTILRRHKPSEAYSGGSRNSVAEGPRPPLEPQTTFDNRSHHETDEVPEPYNTRNCPEDAAGSVYGSHGDNDEPVDDTPRIPHHREEEYARVPTPQPVAQNLQPPAFLRASSPAASYHSLQSSRDHDLNHNENAERQRSRHSRHDSLSVSDREQSRNRGLLELGYDQVDTGHPELNEGPSTQIVRYHHDAHYDDLRPLSPPSPLAATPTQRSRSLGRHDHDRDPHEPPSRRRYEHAAVHRSSRHISDLSPPTEPPDVVPVRQVSLVNSITLSQQGMHDLRIERRRNDSTFGHPSPRNSRTSSEASAYRTPSGNERSLVKYGEGVNGQTSGPRRKYRSHN